MPYADIHDVQARDPTITFSATSTPNASQVALFLADTAAELDGILSALNYSVPIATGASAARAMLRSFNALGANAYVQEVAPTSRGADQARKLWEDAKKMLRSGDVVLPGASSDSGGLPLGLGSGGAAAREPWFAASYADEL